MSDVDAREYWGILDARLKGQRDQVTQLVNRSGAVAAVLSLVAVTALPTLYAASAPVSIAVTVAIMTGLISGVPIPVSRLLAEGPDPSAMHVWYREYREQFFQLASLAAATAVIANSPKIERLEKMLRWQAIVSGGSVVVTFLSIQLGGG